MAAIAEDEQMQVQDFLEQQRLLEEERRQREEAARLLAEQDALAAQAAIPQGGNFMSQPTAQIDALQAQFNAPAPIPRQMIGDEQYQQEVARAQRGSGFVNADVSPTGDVIVPGYDPSKDFAALKAQQEATNLQRNQYVDSLVQGGATYAEAYRAGQGRYPQARNDAMRLRVEQLAQKQNFLSKPLVTQVRDGITYRQTPSGGWEPVPRAAAPATAPVMPRDAAASQKIISGKITDARADLQRAQKRVDATDRTDVNAVNAALRAREKLRGLEQSLVTGSTNWMGAAQAPMPVAPGKQEQKNLTVDVARDLLKAAGGDKAKARKMALDAGYRL